MQKQLFYGSSGEPILRTFSRFADDQGSGTRTKYYFLGDRLVAARQTTSSFTSTGPAWWRGELPPLEVPPLVAAGLVGSVLLLLVVAPGSDRRRVRILVAIAPARAAAVAVILVVGGLPVPLSAQTPPPITHYHLDRLGSVLAVTDATGAVVQQARYRAYGEIRGRFDGGGTPVAESERYRHEYTAWETDVGTSLLYAGARYYDPSLGQFLTHDPAMQFASPYALGPGDPVNTADPTGAESDEVDQEEAEMEEEAEAPEEEPAASEPRTTEGDDASVGGETHRESQLDDPDEEASLGRLGPPPDLDWDDVQAVQRYHDARNLILSMEKLKGSVAGLDFAANIPEMLSRSGVIGRIVGVPLGAAAGLYYSMQITDNVTYQNALRPNFGLPEITTYREALQLGGFSGDLSRLRAEQAHVRREAGLVIRP